MKNVARLLGACLILVTISLFAMKGWQSFSGMDTSNNSSSETKTTDHTPTYTVNTAALGDIQNVINKSSLDISVSITDLQTGESYHYGDTSGFTAASVGKLVTAAAFLHQVDQNKASLEQSVGGTTAREELRLMIVNSDNTAWHNMEMALGITNQQAYAASVNLASYDANANTISSDDVAKLLSKLAKGSLLSDDSTDLLLGYMQQANYRGYIVAAVPDGVSVYHKVGLLEDRVHDVAILKKGDRSFVMAIFTKSAGTYDFSIAPSLFKSITDDALQAFFSTTNS